jgi:outer membrane receptor protein involved in Fe transport
LVGSRLTAAALLSSVAIIQSSAASAQDKPANSKPAAISESESEPATIIVTARKKSERLVDTPISITAFTGEDLKKSGVTKLNDLAVRTPGLQYGNFGDEKLSPTSLRGIVADAGSAGADPAVGIYVDEVFIGQGAGASIDYFDLDRVEVLRGPQGTLFGRNTIGGVINISTVAPTRDFDAQFEGGVGNYGLIQAQGAIGGPLVGETVLGRLSFFGNRRNGVDHKRARLAKTLPTPAPQPIRLPLKAPRSDRDGELPRARLVAAMIRDKYFGLLALVRMRPRRGRNSFSCSMNSKDWRGWTMLKTGAAERPRICRLLSYLAPLSEFQCH